MDKYALVTGASKGIGREMAVQLAEKGYNLLLVSRSEQELENFAQELTDKYQVKAIYLAIDLAAEGAAYRVAEWCTEHTSGLSILINNAGFGLWGSFEDSNLPQQIEMIKLNVDAVVGLTHLLLPALKLQAEAYILNVCSTAAYQAMPTMAVYAATKSFILSYTRALRYELKDTSVAVTCLSPGPTDTGFASRAGLDIFAELAAKFNMKASDVAAIGLKGMFKKEAEVVPGFLNKVSAAGSSILPKRLIEHISAGLYKK